MKNIESSSIVVQWDAVNDSLITTYTVTWTRTGGSSPQVATLAEQTSFTITGLTLDTVYTITVTAANDCGTAPEFKTSIILSINTTFTISSINSYVTVSTNPMITSNSIPNSTTTTAAATSTISSFKFFNTVTITTATITTVMTSALTTQMMQLVSLCTTATVCSCNITYAMGTTLNSSE